MRCSVACVFAPLLIAAIGWAQAPTGAITGTVADPTGAVVTGAVVTVTNPSTNTQRIVSTNSSGIYDVPALMPGTYNLKIEMKGFTTQVRNDIELHLQSVIESGALLLAKNDSLSAAQVRLRLLSTADDVDARGFDQASGYGKLNVARTLADDSDDLR